MRDPASRARPVLIVLLLVSVILGLPVQAAGEPTTIHVVVHDDPAPCPQDTAPCFEIEGWSLVSEEDELEVIFENNASRAHTLVIVPWDLSSDEPGDTGTDDAFVELGPIEPGQSQQRVVTVPGGTEAAYLFCHLDDHEEEGLNETRNVYPAGAVEEGQHAGPGLGDPSSVPVGGLWVLILVLITTLGLAPPRPGA